MPRTHTAPLRICPALLAGTSCTLLAIVLAACGSAAPRVEPREELSPVPAAPPLWIFPTRLPLPRPATHLVPGFYACATLDDGSTTCPGLDRRMRGDDGIPWWLEARCVFPRSDDHAVVKCYRYGDTDATTILPSPARRVVADHELPQLTCCAGCAPSDHFCALLETGEVACWGDGFVGQLGDGTQRGTRRLTPAIVQGLASATDIDSGPGHVCVIDANDAVYCWGSNGYGQLGDGTTDLRTRPTLVAGLEGLHPRKLALGSELSCALLDDGALACWGNATALGIEDASTRARVVRGARPYVEVFAGDGFICARDDAGDVWCGGNPIPRGFQDEPT